MPLCLIFVPPNTEKMKAFFEAIAYLFQEILFIPLNLLRELELTSWFLANGINWVFLIVGFVAASYWIGQLKKFSDSGEEDTDSTSHSFL
ncbi:MAG: DUF6341 family protein [Flavobacteriaceae bacterium]|tara:strand:+ start:1273 stop:1542 length:270 start_codon:yes stop_codon:yes gene_type:complete